MDMGAAVDLIASRVMCKRMQREFGKEQDGSELENVDRMAWRVQQDVAWDEVRPQPHRSRHGPDVKTLSSNQARLLAAAWESATPDHPQSKGMDGRLHRMLKGGLVNNSTATWEDQLAKGLGCVARC